MCDETLGQGMPKICIPIVDRTQAGILASAEALRHSVADLVEWRADYYEGLQVSGRMWETLEKIGQALGNQALLFTVRTQAEGGERAMPFSEYASLLTEAASCPAVQYIDVEMFCGMRGESQEAWEQSGQEGRVWEREEHPAYVSVKELLQELHRKEVTVIGSYHDFEKTPPAEEITRRLTVMRGLGADIPKMAVMPQKQEDVLQLLEATWEARQILDPTPLITMSMGSMGRISRIAGESFGSAVTFGSMGSSSAPGQIEAEQLKQVLSILHDSK